MHRKLLIPALVALFLVLTYKPALAKGTCGIMCQVFGWDAKTVERTQIKEDAATERARLEKEQAERMAEIERQAREATAQAQANATIAQAEKDKYIAYVENWRQSQTELAKFETDKALAALNGQTELGLTAITEAGVTKRWALTTDMIFSVVLIVGLVLVALYFLKKQAQPRTIQILTGHQDQLPPPYRAHLPARKRVEHEIVQHNDQW